MQRESNQVNLRDAQPDLERNIPVREVNIRLISEGLLHFLGAKQKLIVSSRFGISGNEPKTLEAIGKNLNVTRERVRQIEADAINFLKKAKKSKELEDLVRAVSEIVVQKGNIVKSDTLTAEIFEKHFGTSRFSAEEGRMLEIVLLLAGLKKMKGNREIEDSWMILDFSKKNFKEVIDRAESIFSDSKKLFTSEEVSEKIRKSGLYEKNKEIRPEYALNYLDVSKKFGKNVFGDWGKAKWPLIRPRGVREKATLVLLKTKKPLHFREISRLIEEYGLSRKKVHPQTVHNELIRDKRFVLVGRGTYALREWGYEEGTVKDVIISLLKEAGGFMAKDGLLSAVLKKRRVKKATIAVNLSDKKVFEKTSDGYKLKIES